MWVEKKLLKDLGRQMSTLLFEIALYKKDCMHNK